MSKNQTLSALNGYLFETLESLSDPDLTPEQLNMEVLRSRAIKGVAHEIISNAQLALNAKKYADEQGYIDGDVMPAMLVTDDE